MTSQIWDFLSISRCQKYWGNNVQKSRQVRISFISTCVHDFSAKVKVSASIFRKSMYWIWDQNSKAWGRPWDWNCKTETRLWDKNCKAPEPSNHRWVLDYQTACSQFSMSTRVPPHFMIAVPANLRHLKGVSVFKFWYF